MGPAIGGFIGQSANMSWRWVEWTNLLAAGLVLASLLLFQKETYPPTILKWKAEYLRQTTGDHRYVTRSETNALSLARRLKMSLLRPFTMVVQEPTIWLWTAYLAVVYVILFGFLAGYTYIFQETYQLSQGVTGTIFLAMGVGYLIAAIPLSWLVHRWAKQALLAKQTKHDREFDGQLAPEFRLWYAMLGAPAIPTALFWMGWTADKSVSIWSPIIASALFGYGIMAVYFSTYQYLIETYEVYAASALTMISLIRYLVSGGTTVAMVPIYRSIGSNWTVTILAIIGAVFAPAPYLFYYYGAWVRSKSNFATKDVDEPEPMGKKDQPQDNQ